MSARVYEKGEGRENLQCAAMEEVDASELEMMFDDFDDVDDGDIGSGMRGMEKKVSSATLDVGMR